MKYLFSISLILACFFLHAQTLMKVAKFEAKPNDQDARVTYSKKDISSQNGGNAPIVKIVTPNSDFAFESGLMVPVAIEYKIAECWVWWPIGTRQFTIKHQKLGKLVVNCPEPLKEATVYELTLVSGTVKTIVEQTIQSQYLDIAPEPNDAVVTVTDIISNDEYQEKGEFQKQLKPGKYNYRVEAPLYYTEAGTVELKLEAKSELKVSLKPNSGFVQITSLSEDSASVSIDGITTGLKTPCVTGNLKSGEHEITLNKNMFKVWKQKVMVADGQTAQIKAELQVNFAEVKINLPDEMPICTSTTNGNAKGVGMAGSMRGYTILKPARTNTARTKKI